jgi:predicted cupin superfamily sugar epimerase
MAGGSMTADKIVRKLGLVPLPHEGGYFTETYRSSRLIPENALPDAYDGARPLATAIYYLLTPDTFSAFHRLKSDEIYHFYLGDPVEMVLLHPDGSSNTLRIGTNLLDNMTLQVVIPAGVWQGSHLIRGGRFALMGTTMAPGFDPDDYEQGRRDELIRCYPDARDLIISLTR